MIARGKIMTRDHLHYPVIDMKATGQNIRNLMKRNGLTVRDIKEYLNLSALQSVYHWLNGISLPTIDNMYALSRLFSIPIDSIIVGNRGHLKISGQISVYDRINHYFELVYAKRVG